MTWLVWQPVAITAPGTTGAIQYQIAATRQPCAMDAATAGVCVDAGDPATTMQQGALSDGIVALAQCPLPGSRQVVSLYGEFINFVNYMVHGYYDCGDLTADCEPVPDDTVEGWIGISCRGN